MIRTSTLTEVNSSQLLDITHQSDLGGDPEELHNTIHAFFTTDPDIVGTENEGKTNSYYEAIRDMFFHAAEQVDELWAEQDPDNHTSMI